MGVSWRPIYVTFTGGDSDLKGTVRLPTDVKTISAVELQGYRLNGLDGDLAAALYINEIATNNNTLLSNYEHLNGAFYICVCSGNNNYTSGWHANTDGMRCQEFDPRKVPQLTFEVKRVTASPLETQSIPKPSGTDNRNVQLWLRIRVECD